MTNRFPGACRSCGTLVAPGAGTADRDPATGKWGTLHSVCPVLDADDRAYEAWLSRPVTPGMYLLDDDIIKVQPTRSDPSRCYAKRLDIAAPGAAGRFIYEAGLINRLTPEHRMSAEDAAEFGKVWGVCCVCGALLTDPVSISAGIGPVCAGRV